MYVFVRLILWADIGVTAIFPRQNPNIVDMFNFPERLEVLAYPEFRRRVHCYLDGSWERAVHRLEERGFWQYVLRWFLEKSKKHVMWNSETRDVN